MSESEASLLPVFLYFLWFLTSPWDAMLCLFSLKREGAKWLCSFFCKFLFLLYSDGRRLLQNIILDSFWIDFDSIIFFMIVLHNFAMCLCSCFCYILMAEDFSRRSFWTHFLFVIFWWPETSPEDHFGLILEPILIL